MQSYDDHMRDLAKAELTKLKDIQIIKDHLGDQPEVENFDLTPENIEELTRQGVVVVPKTAAVGSTKAVRLSAALAYASLVAVTQQCLEAKGKVKSNKALTREDFPSRQAWRNYQRQKAKGY